MTTTYAGTVHSLGIIFIMLGSFWSCEGCDPNTDKPTHRDDSVKSNVAPQTSAIHRRLNSAQERLTKGGAGGQLIAKSIKAHGGLETWLRQASLAFDFDYQPIAQPERHMHTRNYVYLRSAWARQQELGDAAPLATLGWNGKVAWITPSAEAFPAPARFWALTPYYFVGVPWVFANPGIRYKKLDDVLLDGKRMHRVHISFGDNIGDAPDDYYEVFINAQNFRVTGLLYIVSYPGFFKPGEHSPEKFMRYLNYTDVDGLWFAQRYDAFLWDRQREAPGKKVSDVNIRIINVSTTVDKTRFEPPEGAVISDAIN